jgi:hypothetical protein
MLISPLKNATEPFLAPTKKCVFANDASPTFDDDTRDPLTYICLPSTPSAKTLTS